MEELNINDKELIDIIAKESEPLFKEQFQPDLGIPPIMSSLTIMLIISYTYFLCQVR